MTNKVKNEAVFMVDWDNTLFSTDYLKRTGFHFEYFFDNSVKASQEDVLIDNILFQEVSSLEDVKHTNNGEQELLLFVSKLASLGQVFIVSNAAHSWVEKCLMHFYPKLHGAFRSLAIEIISARDLYSSSDPKDQLKWKVNQKYWNLLGQCFY